MIHYRWNSVPREQLNPHFARQAIHSHRMTVARVHLAQGYTVPRHAHENEQITLLESGRLRFVYDEEERLLEPGDIVVTPANVPHRVDALEDSVALDLFAPVRQDWIRGEDAYLRG